MAIRTSRTRSRAFAVLAVLTLTRDPAPAGRRGLGEREPGV